MSKQLNFGFEPWEGHCVHTPSSWTLLILCEHLRNRKCIMLTMIQYGLYMVTQSWIALSLPTSIARQDSFSLSSFEALISLLESPFSPPNMYLICLLSCGIWVICGQKSYSRILTKVYGLLALGTLANIVPCPDISVRKLGTVGWVARYISKWYTENSEVT